MLDRETLEFFANKIFLICINTIHNTNEYYTPNVFIFRIQAKVTLSVHGRVHNLYNSWSFMNSKINKTIFCFLFLVYKMKARNILS